MFQMEPEIITIEDSDVEVEVIEDDVVMEVNEVNEVNEAGRIFWRMEAAENVEEAGAEIEPSADSDYDSECDGIDYDVHEQIIDTADINAMDDDTRMCAIHIYYQLWGDEQLCARCFLRRRDPYRRNPYIQSIMINVVRTHRTARLGLL